MGRAPVMPLYSLLLAAALLVSSPWWLLRMLTTDRYREGLAQRLGRVPARLRRFVHGRRVLWVHAVSVGEALAGSRLVAELADALGPDWAIVVSTTTRTGQRLARERFGPDCVFYLPLDFAGTVRRYLRALQPEAVVLMESEVWPRLLHECRRAGVPACVVNARVSDRSFRRAMKVRAVWGKVLAQVSLWLAQSDEDARRLIAMGAHADVRVGGNLKYDVRAPQQSRVADLIRKVADGRPVLVAGSTVASTANTPSEEEIVIAAWKGDLRRKLQALLVLAPRHPERFAAAEALAAKFACAKASDSLGLSRQVDIVLLDTIGDLAAVYAVADVAFVGGSLVKRGGHNPLEPAQFGVPVVMGESVENFRAIVAAMQQAHAIKIVADEAELAAAFEHMLTDREAARAMGERGRAVFESQQGATQRAVDAILGLVHP